MNKLWLIFGLCLICIGLLLNVFAAGKKSRSVELVVACANGKTYHGVDIMMFSEGKIVLFTELGQTVIPGSVTCSGRVPG